MKNHTHVKKVGYTSEFLAFTDELEKQIFIKKIKKLLSGPTKNQNSFNIYNVAFFKKKKKKK